MVMVSSHMDNHMVTKLNSLVVTLSSNMVISTATAIHNHTATKLEPLVVTLSNLLCSTINNMAISTGTTTHNHTVTKLDSLDMELPQHHKCTSLHMAPPHTHLLQWDIRQ